MFEVNHTALPTPVHAALRCAARQIHCIADSTVAWLKPARGIRGAKDSKTFSGASFIVFLPEQTIALKGDPVHRVERAGTRSIPLFLTAASTRSDIKNASRRFDSSTCCEPLTTAAENTEMYWISA